MKLDPKLFEFLKKLENNNNRVWFKKNKDQFDGFNQNIGCPFLI